MYTVKFLKVTLNQPLSILEYFSNQMKFNLLSYQLLTKIICLLN